MKELFVWRVGNRDALLVGRITASPIEFIYEPEYLESSNAHALSFSLPLQSEPYAENAMRPYFNGLLPENETRTAIAGALNTTPDDFLSILLYCGREIIGDIAVTDTDQLPINGSYEPLEENELKAIFAGYSSLAESNRESRLSLAGSQGKTGLAHLPGKSLDEGWLRPLDGAASTHVLKVSSLEDIPLLEYLCMRAASEVGIRVPYVDLLFFGRPVFCIERFDRIASMSNGNPSVKRLHQEDFAQAFGVGARAKYSELSPSTASAVADFIRRRSSSPIRDLEEFAKVSLFNYLIGNCDNHLKNMSILYSASWESCSLAPAYDLVSTTRYERFSTEMGMAINGKREIGDIDAADWMAFTRDIGVHESELASFCKQFVATVPAAIQAAALHHDSIPALPWVADDLCEEIIPRLEVLEEVARG